MSLFQIQGLVKRFGGLLATDHVDLSVEHGEVHALMSLLGRNGMGKSTTVKTIVGLIAPMSGSVRFAGQAVHGGKPDAIARLGMGPVREGRRVFPNLTVREHLVCFADNRNGLKDGWTLERI